MTSTTAPRIILRRDVRMGCLERSHMVTGVVLASHPGREGRVPWHLVLFDEPVPRGLWDEGSTEGKPGVHAVIRTRWKAFEVGGRHPTSVDLLALDHALDWPNAAERQDATGFVECMCFTEARYPEYADYLRGDWFGRPPSSTDRRS